jgi:uncharacterized membrane protein YphA (DoxX/SURF4 family)
MQVSDAANSPTNHQTAPNTSVKHYLKQLRIWLLRPTDAATLATYRVLFGALMVWEVVRYHQFNRVYRYYIEPTFYFPYELFPFVSPLPPALMYLVFFVMGLAAFGLALGFFYRVSAVLFFVTYTYAFLLDKTQYNNHYYLIILLAFLLIFVDAHRWASLDQKMRPRLRAEQVPFWQHFIFKAQLVIVYFYAAVAKMNADWLRGEPVRAWLRDRADYPLVGQFFTTEPAAYFFAYGGLLFDLIIGFALLWKRTRLIAVFFVFFFHLTNKWLFSIGIFPYLMIASTVLFFEADMPRRVLRAAPLTKYSPAAPAPRLGYHSLAIGFVIVFLALQVLIPLRHFLYPGHVSWTEEGHRFAWHMKLRDKDGQIAFIVTDPATEKTWVVDLSQDLNARQIGKMSTRPDMILQYAHHLKARAQAQGIENPVVRVDSWAGLNGRPLQQMIDPAVNLADLPQTVFARAPWILPLSANKE